MRHMLKTVVSHAKQDPKEFFGAVLFLLTLSGILYAALWFNYIVNGSSY